jgi:hypothetical protein
MNPRMTRLSSHTLSVSPGHTISSTHSVCLQQYLALAAGSLFLTETEYSPYETVGRLRMTSLALVCSSAHQMFNGQPMTIFYVPNVMINPPLRHAEMPFCWACLDIMWLVPTAPVPYRRRGSPHLPHITSCTNSRKSMTFAASALIDR